MRERSNRKARQKEKKKDWVRGKKEEEVKRRK